MVPVSFPQTLLKSRVMQKYLAGALDDGINGFLDKRVHDVDHRPSRWSRMELGIGCLCPFLPSCLPYFNPGSSFLSFLCAWVSPWPTRLPAQKHKND
jgi:hypothetical protein